VDIHWIVIINKTTVPHATKYFIYKDYSYFICSSVYIYIYTPPHAHTCVCVCTNITFNLQGFFKDKSVQYIPYETLIKNCQVKIKLMLLAVQNQGMSFCSRPAEQKCNAAFWCRFNLTTFNIKMEHNGCICNFSRNWPQQLNSLLKFYAKYTWEKTDCAVAFQYMKYHKF
jgi:hypothetical protein